MTDKEVKSFDTVDLLAPMDLIPIKGIESPALKVETESKQEANTKTDKYVERPSKFGGSYLVPVPLIPELFNFFRIIIIVDISYITIT